MQAKKKKDWKKIIGIILFATLIFSIGYSIFRIITSSPSTISAEEYKNLRSDYILMLIQCCLGLIVMFLPAFLEKRWSVRIPNYMCILYFVFLYCAIYLGEVRRFYYIVPNWDTILHTFSAGMLGAFGFSLVSILNDSEKTKVKLSPFFVVLFAFSFALSIGALWEIYEFTGDGIFGLNMQKYRLADGTMLIGRAALIDTMKDIIVDALSALIVTIIGFFTIKKEALTEEKS